MKGLFKDLAKLPGTTITALYDVPQYPAANVANIFLNKWFISALQGDTVTVDLGADFPMECVYVAGCNADKFTVVAKNALAATVFSIADQANDRNVTPVYFGETLQVRYVDVSADVSLGLAPFVDPLIDLATNLKIKGIGCGECFNLPGDLLNGFTLPRTMNTRFSRSQGGQYTSSQYEPLRERNWTFDNVEWDDLKLIEAAIQYLGYKNPTFFDMFDESTTYDPPMYMVIDDVIQPERVRGDLYRFTLKMKEAR